MTDLTIIKRIGYRQVIKAITAGLITGYIIMAVLAGPFWLFSFNYAPAILFATIMIYLAGYFIGALTGVWIIKHKAPAILFGIIAGFLIVWIATFSGSLIGFMEEGLPGESQISEAVHDYIYKPMALVTMFGSLPIILIGIWFGLSIKRKGEEEIKHLRASG